MNLRKIAVLTSGGDAPGMNAAIRAVVRAGVVAGAEVHGVRRGFAGLLTGDLSELGARDVGGILGRGGTVLGSARCAEFRELGGPARAIEVLASRGIEGLVVIGGNGSQSGALALARAGFPVVGVASTIDNDLPGSDVTIGVDTALNIALEAIDRLRTTATSHHRAFLVEVMGRDCGYLALAAGVAGGAEAILLPEHPTRPEELAAHLAGCHHRGKQHALVVVAEGATPDAVEIERWFREHRSEFGFEARATVLGHVQRGGAPTAFDRLLATRLGAAAAERLIAGERGVLVGLIDGEIRSTPLELALATKKPLDPELCGWLTSSSGSVTMNANAKSRGRGGLVYSTEGRDCPKCGWPVARCACAKPAASAPVGGGSVRVGREAKGRGGKAVTIITGLPLAGEDLAKLATELKRRCGSGGTIKAGAIEIQGDHRDTLVEELTSRGFRAKRSGG